MCRGVKRLRRRRARTARKRTCASQPRPRPRVRLTRRRGRRTWPSGTALFRDTLTCFGGGGGGVGGDHVEEAAGRRPSSVRVSDTGAGHEKRRGRCGRWRLRNLKENYTEELSFWRTSPPPPLPGLLAAWAAVTESQEAGAGAAAGTHGNSGFPGLSVRSRLQQS